MNNNGLIWKSGKAPHYGVGVYERPNIDIIARVVCGKELEEARKRVIIERRKYFYQPSLDYVRERLRFRPRAEY